MWTWEAPSAYVRVVDVVQGLDVPVAADPSGELGTGGLADGKAGDGVDDEGPPVTASGEWPLLVLSHVPLSTSLIANGDTHFCIRMHRWDSLISADPDVSRHGLESIWSPDRPDVHTPVIAAARRLAGPGRISRVPSPWIGHGR